MFLAIGNAGGTAADAATGRQITSLTSQLTTLDRPVNTMCMLMPTQATSHASQLVLELTQRVATLEGHLDDATASAVEATAVTGCVSAGEC